MYIYFRKRPLPPSRFVPEKINNQPFGGQAI